MRRTSTAVFVLQIILYSICLRYLESDGKKISSYATSLSRPNARTYEKSVGVDEPVTGAVAPPSSAPHAVRR